MPEISDRSDRHLPVEVFPSPTRQDLVPSLIEDLRLLTSYTPMQSLLEKAESDLVKLQIIDGGAESPIFKKDLEQINKSTTTIKDDGCYLPNLEIMGLDANKHIEVEDKVTGKIEILKIDNGIFGPDAPISTSANHELLKNYDKSEISPDVIGQGYLGECHFLSVLKSFISKYPDGAKEMVCDNDVSVDGTHTYTVTFPGDKDHPVTVSEPNSYELATFGNIIDTNKITKESAAHREKWTDNQELLVSIIEKAYRKFTGFSLHTSGDEYVMGLFATNTTQFETRHTTAKDTAETLSSAQDNCRLVVAATDKHTTPVRDVNGQKIEIEAGHAYEVVNYDPVSERVTVSNPWGLNTVHKNGHEYATANPSISMSLNEFRKNFSVLEVGDMSNTTPQLTSTEQLTF